MREYLSSHAPHSLALGGLLIGMMLGAIVFRTNFCAMGSISDMMSFGDYRRFRAWVLSAATAIIGTQWLDRKSTRLNSSHIQKSRMPSSA